MAGPQEIHVGRAQGALYVRVVGPATALLAPGIQGLFERARAESVAEILMDLSGSPVIDSTMSGCLVSYTLAGNARSQPPLRLVCPSEGCRRALSQMHLDRVLQISEQRVSAPPNLEVVPVEQLDPIARTEQIILAHRKLCEVDERNRSIFGRIAETLEKDLADRRPAADRQAASSRQQPDGP